ncbi:Crp/Fnr family transcriptional regulator [Thiofaba sp. EF100]|jgi:CRP-like cAMP-binding protein|uniref:Crp/Fnr family transcriptional regulator n=1 Tax=Thiofaba sp. EF100 TaxID=3121274 RepID=UPI0032213CD4
MISPEERSQLAKILREQWPSETMKASEYETFLEYCELIEVKQGEIIADIGEVGEALYFVVEGEVSLVTGSPASEVEVGRIHAGELMGEMSFFDRKPRQVRLKAATPRDRLLKLSRPMYKRLRIEHPYIAVNLLEYAIISLDHLFRRASEDVTILSHYLYAGSKF